MSKLLVINQPTMNKKEKAMKYYFKRYLLGCDYTEFVEWLDDYFTRAELDAIATYLFKKSTDLWYTEEEDDDIVEKAINNVKIHKFWFTY